MVVGLPARLLLRVDHKTALRRLNISLYWLRLLEFVVSTTFLGIFVDFALGLPHGFDISNKMTAVYAMSIVATAYPILIWTLWLILRAKKRKVLSVRVFRTADSLVVAPLLIATAVVLGNAGLPGDCKELYSFDRIDFVARSGNITVQADCGVTDPTNECGSGFKQIAALNARCSQAKAGFGLVIVTIVIVYLMILLANIYLFYRPSDDSDPDHPRGHRRGPSLANGMSESTQHLNDMSQLGCPPAAHIASDNAAVGEPPPPYTSRPGNNERVASADEVQRTHMLSRITNTPSLSPGIADHPVFELRRADSILSGSTEDEPPQRSVNHSNPRLVTQPSIGALSSHASVREASEAVSPIDEEIMPMSIRTVGLADAEPSATDTVSPISTIQEIVETEGAQAVRALDGTKLLQPSYRLADTPRSSGLPTRGRGSWGYSITVMLDEDGESAEGLRRGGSNASAPARV